ncbi:hypothetical protein LUZ60_009788 [Juncus effusus]|nr:hypothetical protein LUZ60_009788 [Juncus effusus]
MMASPFLNLIHQHDLHDWSQPLMYNIDYTSNANNEVNLSRLSSTVESPSLNPPVTLSSLMVQDLGFHGTIPNNNLINPETLQTRFQPRIKDEITQETQQNQIHENYYQMIDEKLLLRALHNSTHNIPVPSTGDFVPNNGSRISGCNYFEIGGNNYSMVPPSANVLGLFPNPLPLLPCILDMDLHAYDLFASTRLDSKQLLREDASLRLNEMQDVVQGQPCANHPKMSSLISGVMEPRGMNSSVLENKASQTIPKKSRFESHSPSFSSFKVRKEKLGDRIAALQQLVAPFGKTDTASVLMEAIGYIKFLQDQVETLSVPYLRSSRNKKRQRTQEGSNGEKEKPKPDLRSRGLCLVPLSCTSYVTNENGGVWPSHPNFRGNT